MITVKFGNYNYFDENDKRPIEWLVLDKKDGKYLLLSKCVIAEGLYNRRNDLHVTWEKCGLRRWLNSEFLNEAFSPEEQERIITSDVTAGENPFVASDVGNDTKDKVFLLSIMEVHKYFHSPSQRKCKWPDGIFEGRCEVAPWWLRTSSYRGCYTSVVNHDGSISYVDHTQLSSFVDIRPSIWVSFDGLFDFPVENPLLAGYNEDSSLIDKLLVEKMQVDDVNQKFDDLKEKTDREKRYATIEEVKQLQQLSNEYNTGKTIKNLEDE